MSAGKARRGRHLQHCSAVVKPKATSHQSEPRKRVLMSVDKDAIRRVAELAQIAVSEDELDKLAGELNETLSWVEQLAELDVKNVEPMTSPTEMQLALRADEVTDGNRPDDVLMNAPNARAGFYTVPKVVE